MTKSVFSDRYDRLLAALVKARRDAGATQVELAGRLGKPQSYVSKIENGERRVDMIELIDICSALDISILSVINAIAQND